MAERLKLDWDGRHYTLDLDAVLGSQWDEIERATGLTPFDVMEFFAEARKPTVAITRVYAYLFFVQAGENVKLADLDVPFGEFWTTFARSTASVVAAGDTPKAAAAATKPRTARRKPSSAATNKTS